MLIVLCREIKPFHATVSVCPLFLTSATLLSAWNIGRAVRAELQSVEMCFDDSMQHKAYSFSGGYENSIQFVTA
jgi:hypothetical protein